MKSLGFGRLALTSCVAAALLAGCGGSQSPIAAPGAMTQSRAITTQAKRAGSWMIAAAKKDDLLYVSDDARSQVYVFSYPSGELVGTLTGFQNPEGECSDRSGNVWIVNFTPSEVIEYAHGGTTPIATLSDPSTSPIGCSVDPTSGNLALTNEGGILYVFSGAQGTPVPYQDSSFSTFWYCTYDDVGNLFVSGQSNSENLLAELPTNGSALKDITLNKTLDAGSIQWDGAYLAVYDLSGGSRGPVNIDRIQISGDAGTIIATTVLNNKKNRRPTVAVQYWIQGHTILGPDAARHGILRLLGYWKYPEGGKQTKTTNMSGDSRLLGVAVSVAPSH